MISKERDGLAEERQKLMSSYKEELSKLHTGISVKSKEEEKTIRQLHSDKIDLQSKLDTTTFKLTETEHELKSKKSMLDEYMSKYEKISHEFSEITEAKRQITQEFELKDKLL